jgi:hypothetical protein
MFYPQKYLKKKREKETMKIKITLKEVLFINYLFTKNNRKRKKKKETRYRRRKQ